MTRWRIVGEQNGGPEHVSTVVLTEEEARQSLLVEADLHERFGWTTTLGLNADEEPDVLICRKLRRRDRTQIVRAFTIREFDPMDDLREESNE
jgi:hypothetical protein